jgi:hypothetical protein
MLFSCRERDGVCHECKVVGKITVLCVLILYFLTEDGNTEVFELYGSKRFGTLICS